MGSSSTGQGHEVMALDAATNSTSILIPAAEVLGLVLALSWYMNTFLPVAAEPLQTQAGSPCTASSKASSCC